MRRRDVLAGAAVLALADAAAAADAIRLWPGAAPGPGSGPGGAGLLEEDGTHGTVVRHVADPSLQVVRPARPTGAAMIVAGGGGYRRIETGTEAVPAAEWLAARGITAFVLRYRLPGEGWSSMAPLQDAQRALRLVRQLPGIDAGRVGLLGFSAGAHLLGLLAARAGQSLYPAADAIDAAPAHPALAALLYPVISMLPPFERTVTRRQLAGDDRAAQEWFSVDRQVTRAMPPVFLAQSLDDPVSPADSTLLMLAACRAAAVPVEAHLFATGGHGWGMGSGETAQWPGLLAAWLATRQF